MEVGENVERVVDGGKGGGQAGSGLDSSTGGQNGQRNAVDGTNLLKRRMNSSALERVVFASVGRRERPLCLEGSIGCAFSLCDSLGGSAGSTWEALILGRGYDIASERDRTVV